MKQNRKMISLFLAVCMILSMIPAVAAAETTQSYGASIGTGVSAVADRHNLVFGDGTVQWLVLDADETTVGTAGIAVISKALIESDIAFNAGGLDNAWANSDAKTYLAELSASIFDADTLGYIMATTKDASSAVCFDTNWGEDALSGEQLFFLSAEEVEQYFYSGSVDGLIASCGDVADGWWLRSAYADRDIFAGVVSDSGFVGNSHVASTWGARPAFNISADSVAVSSAAVGGKVSGTVGSDALVAVEEAESAAWKLTLIDDAHSAFTATIGDGADVIAQTSGYDAWQLPITYSGAVAGDNEYVSVMICNQAGDAIYYGHIASNSASGTVDVNMPAGLSGKYTVYVFAEQCNGDNATDYGSALVSAELEIDDTISSVDSWGLTLEGDIRVDFIMNIAESAIQDSGSYISVAVDGAEEKYSIADITPDENGKYMVSANVAAAQMTENIVLQVITSEKEGSKFIYSVRGYGDYILSSDEYDDSTKDLVKAMLVYGGKAQDYFCYNTNDLADNGISVASTVIPYTEDLTAVKAGSSSNVKYYGASLVHENQTAVRFYFLSDDTAIENVTFSAQLADGTVIDGLTVTKSGSRYYVQISNIAPDKLCDDITVSVDGLSVTYSPFCYMHRMYYKDGAKRVMRELVQAMYNYYLNAVAYVAA